MATTMKDVARQAGVDVSTVSLAINNDPRIRIETRERILRIAGDLSYRKNLLARGLRSGKSFTVGAIVDAASSVGNAVLVGAHSVLGPLDYHLLLDYLCGSPGCDEQRPIEGLKSKRIDGLLIAPEHQPDTERDDRAGVRCAYAALQSDDIPFVFVDHRAPGVDADLVAIDNTAAIETAVAYLNCLGHRRIGYAFEPCRTSPAELERLHGYDFAMRAAGTYAIRFAVPGGAGVQAEGTGEPPMAELIRQAQHGDVTALIVASDTLALRVTNAVEDAGLQVPRDISVIAVGGSPLTGQIRPELTTLTLPHRQTGVTAATLLYERILGDRSDFHEVRLPAELTLRSSCAPPSTQRRNTMPAGRNTG